jgi:putative ABC transport system permease protein
VISFAVARRRELGIRLAIGARPRGILLMILKQGATLALAGAALGLTVSVAVSRFAASLLYGVSPMDPLTFVAVPVFLVAVAVLACLLPARAAARVDPVDVLRSE